MVYQMDRTGHLRRRGNHPFQLIFLYEDDTHHSIAMERRVVHLCGGLGTRNDIVRMICHKDGSYKDGFVQVTSTRGGTQEDNKYYELSADGQRFLPNGPRSTNALRDLLASRGMDRALMRP